MNEHAIREAIDACRPQSDDLRQPEMSELTEALAREPDWQAVYRRAQRCDGAIAAAFHDVPVPAGLEERLLAAVSASATGEAVPASTGSSGLAEMVTTSRIALRTRRSVLRNWRFQLSAAATAAAALVLLFVFRSVPVPLPELDEDFRVEVIGWAEQVQQGQWIDELATAAVPLDSAIRANPRRWAQLATRYDRQTVAYDLTPPNGAFACAFCIPVRGRSGSLPALPAAAPFATTGGVAIGAWQTQEFVYVLCVRGGQDRYRTFISTPILIGFGRGPATPSSHLIAA